jgi:hypothetical protein
MAKAHQGATGKTDVPSSSCDGILGKSANVEEAR